MEKDDSAGISDKIEIVSTEDKKLKEIGEILSSDTSRKILMILFNQSMTANEIAQKTEISLPLVIYHLKKMQEANVVKITNIGKNTKSHEMKYYTVDKFAIVILPKEMSSSAKKSKSLLNSFTRIHRLATLSGVTIAAWFSSQFVLKSNAPTGHVQETTQIASPEMSMKSIPSEEDIALSMEATEMTSPMEQPLTTHDPMTDILLSVVVALGVIILGLIIELVISRKKKEQIV